MKASKWTPLLLSLIIAGSMAACSSSSNGGAANSASESANAGVNEAGANSPAANEGAAEAEELATPEMDFDMGGRTIKIVSWWDMTIPEDNPDNIQKKKNLDELMKKHNFKVEYVAIDYGEYQQKVVASLLAGEPIGDIVRLGKTYTIPTLVKQDLLWPVDEYTKNSRAFNQKVTDEYMQYEGRGYGFTDNQANLVQGVFYNKTLMNQLGLKPLQDYVNEDAWNWDAFIQVIKDSNKDTNNDGKLDTWGLANSNLMDHALYSNEAALTLGEKQNLDDPKTLESLNFISRLATEKLARPTEGGDWTEPGQFFRQGNTLMYAGALWEIGGFKTDMADYELGFVPFPKGPSATSYHSAEALFQSLTIPKAVEHPEQLLYIWEKIHDIESVYDYPDQGSYETNFTTEEDIENAKMVAPNMIVLDHNTFPNLKYYDFVGELNAGTSVSTVVEKYKAAFQAAIDEVYQN
ncbi:extracellular solute-binding protein [Paenibacillus sp. FSL W8-1187]|uniref:N-Acetyl-D-glucosamine ABC transport system, sugar-binding protein n=1 Tax=Paenibacillus pasadenensis TaxID=217090 RepID=A0A2N5N6E7_9BACL|nr:extracellular solute-binding protein [Paenibacillus pasadenensis]PLT45880.1 N-Acetyl-D-glucosamine ABC transport system, sugar-binding protein [Paenibacillus pasadenensis]